MFKNFSKYLKEDEYRKDLYIFFYDIILYSLSNLLRFEISNIDELDEYFSTEFNFIHKKFVNNFFPRGDIDEYIYGRPYNQIFDLFGNIYIDMVIFTDDK